MVRAEANSHKKGAHKVYRPKLSIKIITTDKTKKNQNTRAFGAIFSAKLTTRRDDGLSRDRGRSCIEDSRQRPALPGLRRRRNWAEWEGPSAGKEEGRSRRQE